MEYETRTSKIVVTRKGEPIFEEFATSIEIADEAAGEYLEVSQCSDSHDGKIAICKEEWPVIRAAINKMLKQCR
jgi:hypothetical protein